MGDAHTISCGAEPRCSSAPVPQPVYDMLGWVTCRGPAPARPQAAALEGLALLLPHDPAACGLALSRPAVYGRLTALLRDTEPGVRLLAAGCIATLSRDPACEQPEVGSNGDSGCLQGTGKLCWGLASGTCDMCGGRRRAVAPCTGRVVALACNEL